MTTPPWGNRKPDVMASRVTKDPKSGLTYRKASIRDAKPFAFAWDKRVLLDNVNLLVGVEGIGKGTLVAWIIAHLTRGDLPGDLEGQPSEVAVIGDEDSYENVWVPRIHAAGGDIDKVSLLEASAKGDGIDIKRDAKALQVFVREYGIRALYFDQLLDNIGYADSWKDQQVRNALAPLRTLAGKENVAVLATVHPNKVRGKTLREIISGSAAFNAISRSSLLVAAHPHQRDLRVVVRPKGNYSVEPPAFEFAIEPHSFYPSVRGRGRQLIKTSRVTDWRENTMLAWDDVLGSSGGRRKADSKAGIARAALTQLFADGNKRRADAVLTELYELHGLDGRVVSDAATELKLHKWQEGFPGVWWWSPNGSPPGDVADSDAAE